MRIYQSGCRAVARVCRLTGRTLRDGCRAIGCQGVVLTCCHTFYLRLSVFFCHTMLLRWLCPHACQQRTFKTAISVMPATCQAQTSEDRFFSRQNSPSSILSRFTPPVNSQRTFLIFVQGNFSIHTCHVIIRMNANGGRLALCKLRQTFQSTKTFSFA